MASFTSFARWKAVNAEASGRELTEDQRQGLPAGFEAVGEALASGDSPVAACAVVGRAMACDGASLGEALSGLRATYHAVVGVDPSFDASEALSVAWGESTLDFLHDLSCEDPLTGLVSLSHLRTRLSEVYREADRTGISLRDTHALLVVDAASGARLAGADAPFARALRLAEVAEAVRTVFCGEETLGRVGGNLVVALVRRDPGLGDSVTLLDEILADLGLGGEVRLWLEGLPANPDLGVKVLSDLAR